MPEITDAEFRQFVTYQQLGTPDEVRRKIDDLVRDNGKQRDELRERDEKLKALPPEGAVVLTGDDAKAWPTLKELGKPDEVRAKLEQGEKDKAALAERDRRDQVRSAAEAAGFKVSVLEKLPGAEGLTFEGKEETVRDAAGKETKAMVAYVTGSEEGATPKKLADHAEAAWKDFLPALQAMSDGKKGGTRFPDQSAGGEAPKLATEGGVDDAIKQMQDRASAPNALRPAAKT
jgi:hypothetical protein